MTARHHVGPLTDSPPKVGHHSPWGVIQCVAPIGDQGITWVSTAGHGGVFVPRLLLDSVPAAHQAYAARWSRSRQWFEEDCAAALVVLAFPHLYTRGDHIAAEDLVRQLDGGNLRVVS